MGYLSILEDDGYCYEDVLFDINLFTEPNNTFGGVNYRIPSNEPQLCSGGIRVLIEDVQEDWVKIIVSDGTYEDASYDEYYGWVPKSFVKAKWETEEE